MRDPRLEIPEILRTPVKRPEYPDQLSPKSAGHTPDVNMAGLSKGYALAIEFMVFMIVCGGAGYVVDRYVVQGGQTWTVVGTVCGLIGGCIRAYRTMKTLSDDDSHSG